MCMFYTKQLKQWNINFTVRKKSHKCTHVRAPGAPTAQKLSPLEATTTWLEFTMSILTNFKPKDSLPNHKGPLSLSIPLQLQWLL